MCLVHLIRARLEPDAVALARRGRYHPLGVTTRSRVHRNGDALIRQVRKMVDFRVRAVARPRLLGKAQRIAGSFELVRRERRDNCIALRGSEVALRLLQRCVAFGHRTAGAQRGGNTNREETSCVHIDNSKKYLVVRPGAACRWASRWSRQRVLRSSSWLRALAAAEDSRAARAERTA